MKKIILLAAALVLVALTGCKKSKVDIKGVADLAGKKIGVQTGTTGELFVQEEVENANLVSFKSGIDAALDLKNGAIDCVILDELPAQEIVKRNTSLKIIRDPYLQKTKKNMLLP